MYFHKPQEKPRRWGSFQDVQYAIRKNAERIYQVDPDSIVLAMPLFWGLPPMDYSGKNNHGTNHGAAYKDGSLDFDGSSDYVDTQYNHNSGIGSISLWVKPDNLTGERLFVGHHDGNNRRFYAGIKDDDIFWGFGDTFKNNVVSGMTTGNWHHIVSTGDDSTAKYYINNVEKDTFSYSWNAGASSNDLFVGAVLAGNMVYTDGAIDEVHISNVARTADQIALFHDLPWALYQPVSRPIYFFQTAEGISIPVAMQNMRGGFNPIGMRGGFINAD